MQTIPHLIMAEAGCMAGWLGVQPRLPRNGAVHNPGSHGVETVLAKKAGESYVTPWTLRRGQLLSVYFVAFLQITTL